MLRQSVNLGGIEHIGLLEERYRAAFLFAGGRVFFRLDELIGVDNRRTFLALANAGIHLEGSLKPKPVRRTVSFLFSIKPQG
jgi:hypothetical protein